MNVVLLRIVKILQVLMKRKIDFKRRDTRHAHIHSEVNQIREPMFIRREKEGKGTANELDSGIVCR